MANKKYTRRADGLYQKCITMGRKPNGKYNRKIIYAKTIKELEASAAEYKRKYSRGTLSADENMTFGEAATAWLDTCKNDCRTSTRSMYQTAINKHLLPTLAAMRLTELRPMHLRGILNDMYSNGKAASTMRIVKITAAAIIDFAIENDVVYRNVFRKVDVPNVPAHTRRPLSEEEIKLIISTWEGHRLGVPALLMLYCGLRRGEMLALTWGDIDVKNMQINVNKALRYENGRPVIGPPKTENSIRTVPIPEILRPALSEIRKSSLFVCPSARGELMTKQAFKKAWQSYLNYLNTCAGGYVASRSRLRSQVIDPCITPHMFRHTYATLLYNSSVDVKSAQHFLGHADIQTTLGIYTHLTEKKQNDAVSALNAHLNTTTFLLNKLQ